MIIVSLIIEIKSLQFFSLKILFLNFSREVLVLFQFSIVGIALIETTSSFTMLTPRFKAQPAILMFTLEAGHVVTSNTPHCISFTLGAFLDIQFDKLVIA
jgi:hypothetical protein